MIGIIVYCHKHILPCTFVLMTLCIWECSLFFLHSYHCGKTLDIYVTVVNRSSNLSWMIVNGFVDLETCIDLCLYIFPFFFFAKKSSPNVNLQMIVRLNLINHALALFHDKFACNIALRNIVFRWESCKGSVWESVKKCSRQCSEAETRG